MTSPRLISATRRNLRLLLMVPFLTGLSGDGVLFSFLALQLKEQTKRFDGNSHLAFRAAESIFCLGEIAAGGISGRALGRLKVQRMQQCCGSSLMALRENPGDPGCV